jgi:hypothetical protein
MENHLGATPGQSREDFSNVAQMKEGRPGGFLDVSPESQGWVKSNA